MKKNIIVKYRFIDGYHIFTSEDVYGLYVASKDPEKAFNNVQGSIEKLIKLNDDIDIKVEPPDFLRNLLDKALLKFNIVTNKDK